MARFAFDEKQLDIFLHPLEKAILQTLWAMKSPVPVHARKIFTAVVETYRTAAGTPPAYTTITTVLVRMVETRLLDRFNDRSNYVYSPVHKNETQFKHAYVDYVIGAMLTNFPAESGASIKKRIKK